MHSNYKTKWCVERRHVSSVVKNCCENLVIDNCSNVMHVLTLCVFMFSRTSGVSASSASRYW